MMLLKYHKINRKSIANCNFGGILPPRRRRPCGGGSPGGPAPAAGAPGFYDLHVSELP